jgi:hypothetical protein
MVSYIKSTWFDGVWEETAVMNIWIEERRSDRKLEKIHNEEKHQMLSRYWNQGGIDGLDM